MEMLSDVSSILTAFTKSCISESHIMWENHVFLANVKILKQRFNVSGFFIYCLKYLVFAMRMSQ